MLVVDEMVGSLVDELEAVGKLANTYIAFTSDNGWLAGEHRIPKERDRLYEESARVPVFVRGPGVPAGSEAGELILKTDLAPTFAELVGKEFAWADGRSIAPLLRGEEPHSWRSSVLLEGIVGKPRPSTLDRNFPLAPQQLSPESTPLLAMRFLMPRLRRTSRQRRKA